MPTNDHADRVPLEMAAEDRPVGIATLDIALLVVFGLLCIATPLVLLAVIRFVSDTLLPALHHGVYAATSHFWGGGTGLLG